MLKILKILLIVIVLKGLAWSLFVPLWQFPDEQAHFGHVALNAEKEYLIKTSGKDQNLEIATSEDLLGTLRSTDGSNKFTFHPEYNLEYSNSQTGIFEDQIKSLPIDSRHKLVLYETASYPELYYGISAVVYKLFYQSNLFIRVFSIRLFWLLAYLVIIYSGFKISQFVFNNNQLATLTSTILIAFHPMFNFVSSGVTSDNLHNALFSLVLLISANLIINGFSWFKLLSLIILTYLGSITKPQFLIALAIWLPLLFFKLIPKKFLKKTIFGLTVLILIFLIALNQKIINLPYFHDQSAIINPNYSLIRHTIFSINHTIREVIPWYWGVFRWLSLALPRWVNRVLNRILIIAAMGLVFKIFSIFNNKKISKSNQVLFFSLYSAVIYYLALFFWDWGFVRTHNFSFGIQGRYYFPVIITHMILLTSGIQKLFSFLGSKFEKLSLWLLSIWFIVLNWIAFFWVTTSYYSFPLKTFINQASQYKPFFAKGYWLIISLVFSLFFSIVLLIKLTNLFMKKNER